MMSVDHESYTQVDSPAPETKTETEPKPKSKESKILRVKAISKKDSGGFWQGFSGR